MNLKHFQFVKAKWFIASGYFVLGALVILGIRFATYKLENVHYHANFSLYINGQKEEFKNPKYYTEVAVCAVNAVILPSERAHMHDNVNDVVHVEDHAATWGQFFTNIGWYMGPNFISSPDGTIYAENAGNKLNLILNGQDDTGYGGLVNTVIKDQDKLLVSYGNESPTSLQEHYDAISSTAAKYDVAKDPKSCSGHRDATVQDRFDHLF